METKCILLPVCVGKKIRRSSMFAAGEALAVAVFLVFGGCRNGKGTARGLGLGRFGRAMFRCRGRMKGRQGHVSVPA